MLCDQGVGRSEERVVSIFKVAVGPNWPPWDREIFLQTSSMRESYFCVCATGWKAVVWELWHVGERLLEVRRGALGAVGGGGVGDAQYGAVELQSPVTVNQGLAVMARRS